MTPAADLAPPANPRCQIYLPRSADVNEGLKRCANEGTHWVKWSGCGCIDDSADDCTDDFFSWECDDHLPKAGQVT